ncbi:LysR substrate-binding domain-containing protein [Terasakiella pusilla]|uniref:LysR substrate-binding domain-containing protein n=1 Tax=Terasakiella pusilla TaxID=64973 RepID=UPI0005714280|nr:LysR substrate-binding domain-containing protein [Terasakiella pusilla]
MNQRRLLPSISMLSAFESAARLKSFSKAAIEQNLTQGAISRQIRALEDQLDIKLFDRVGHQVQLTHKGAQYAKEIAAALGIIRSSTFDLLTSSQGRELHLGVLPTFGSRWLVPRLSGFVEENPDVNITFKNYITYFDMNEEDVDLAIHYGQPDWPNAECFFLMDETVIPVFSPELQEKYGIETLEDLVKAPLLHLSTRKDHWSRFFHLNGINVSASQGILFEHFSSIARAASASLGVALIPEMFVEKELASGALNALKEGACKSSSSYYIVVPSQKVDYQPVALFRDWLIANAR